MIHNRLVSAILVSTAIFVSLASAQDEPPSSRPPASAPAKTFNLDFAGGSVSDYIKAVRKAAADANVAVLSDLSSVPMPAVQLKNVDAEAALRLLQALPHDYADGRRIDMKVEFGSNRRHEDAPRVFSVSAEIDRKPAGTVTDSLVISIADVVNERLKADDVLTAIQTALEMFNAEAPPAKIRFHEATSLIIARGQSEQMATIAQVVNRLREQASSATAQMKRQADFANAVKRDSQERIADLEKQLRETANRAETQAKYIESLKQQVEELRRQLSQAN